MSLRFCIVSQSRNRFVRSARSRSVASPFAPSRRQMVTSETSRTTPLQSSQDTTRSNEQTTRLDEEPLVTYANVKKLWRLWQNRNSPSIEDMSVRELIGELPIWERVVIWVWRLKLAATAAGVGLVCWLGLKLRKSYQGLAEKLKARKKALTDKLDAAKKSTSDFFTAAAAKQQAQKKKVTDKLEDVANRLDAAKKSGSETVEAIRTKVTGASTTDSSWLKKSAERMKSAILFKEASPKEEAPEKEDPNAEITEVSTDSKWLKKNAERMKSAFFKAPKKEEPNVDTQPMQPAHSTEISSKDPPSKDPPEGGNRDK